MKLGAWKNTATLDRLNGAGTADNNGDSYAQAGFTLTGRAGMADDQLMTIADYIGGGLVYTGPLKNHDTDQLGFAIAAAHFGAPYQASTGETLKREITCELTYRWDIRNGLSVQPDLQYVQNPYGRCDLDDAVVVGLRLRRTLWPCVEIKLSSRHSTSFRKTCIKPPRNPGRR